MEDEQPPHEASEGGTTEAVSLDVSSSSSEADSKDTVRTGKDALEQECIEESRSIPALPPRAPVAAALPLPRDLRRLGLVALDKTEDMDDEKEELAVARV